MASIEPSGGSVVLRSIKIDLNSEIGHAFVTDCVRFIEGLITEEQLRKTINWTMPVGNNSR
jgi:hypothetical protein